jgi:hypothetical protein
MLTSNFCKSIIGHFLIFNAPFVFGNVEVGHRQIWAWATLLPEYRDKAIQQLSNSSWTSILDGIQAWCGCQFTDTGLFFNQTRWEDCQPLRQAAKTSGLKFQLVIVGAVPQNAIENPTPYLRDAIDFFHRYPEIDGFSIDDERDCAPRSTVDELEGWIAFHNAFAEGLSHHGLHVTSAVQAMFGIQNDVDNHPCLYPPYNERIKLPANYDFIPRVPELMSMSTIQKWLVMDTYYYSTGHFLTTLDWHTHHVANEIIAIGMSNQINYRDNWTSDELQARFYALHRSAVDWINIFILPVNDEFFHYLKRWKTQCRGCGKQPILGCFDLDIICNVEPLDTTSNLEKISDLS